MNVQGLDDYVARLRERFFEEKKHWRGEHILVENAFIKGMERALELLYENPNEEEKTMANAELLDDLAAAYAHNLNQLLDIESATLSTRALKDVLKELDPDWRDNIDDTLLAIVEMAEEEMDEFIKSGLPVVKTEVQYAARSTINGGVFDFFGFFNDKEGVQAAIDMTGRPQNFEIVRRGVTKWLPLKEETPEETVESTNDDPAKEQE